MEITIFEVFCFLSVCRNITAFWNARPSKGKFLDTSKARIFKPRGGEEEKQILHILEALQTAPRKGANTFQAGSCIYSHDILEHQTICSVYKQQPFGWMYFRRTDGFVVRYYKEWRFRFRFGKSPVWRARNRWSPPFETKLFWLFTLCR